jgi:uncharacterized membrane protein
MLNANHVGCAFGLTLGAFFALCSLFFVAWPSGYMAATGMLFHGFALDQGPHTMSLVTVVTGALCVAIVGYVVGAAYALIFNALAGAFRPNPVPLSEPR